MKKTFFAALTGAGLLTLSLTYSSCKKNESIVSGKNETPSSFRTDNANPFDFVGDLHNRALDEVARSNEFSSLTDDATHDIIQNFMNDELNITDQVDYNNIKFCVDYVNGSVENALNLPNEIRNAGVISNDVYDNIVALYDAVGITRLTQILKVSDAKSPQQAFADVATLEESIIAQYGAPSSTDLSRVIDLNEDEGKATYLLIACAIAKYSYSYWYDVMNNPGSKWHVIFENEESSDGDMEIRTWLGDGLRWCARAGADVGGFFGSGSVSVTPTPDGKGGVKATLTYSTGKISDAVKSAGNASAKMKEKQKANGH